MKKSIKITGLFVLLLIASMGKAQGPPDPDPDPTGNGDNGIGGEAPIDSGLSIFIILGVAYGTRKTLKLRSLD